MEMHMQKNSKKLALFAVPAILMGEVPSAGILEWTKNVVYWTGARSGAPKFVVVVLMSPRPFLLLAAIGAFAAAVAVGIDSRNSEVPEALEQRQLTSAVVSSERTRERESIPAKSAAELIPVPMAPQPPHYAARQVEVTFSDGKSVHVVVQKPMLPNPPYMPAERFLDQYEALAARAQSRSATIDEFGDGIEQRQVNPSTK
jgi:hypothetical protein